ncbi:MAG TPA: hypothetical protein VH969_26615 [Actinophytocola sp.]|jgi:hypothetical protein|uniref:hypothetical protein n=1 Tax=Actinophytocola sp. TaxID=1872138 RepID=UPI002F93817B
MSTTLTPPESESQAEPGEARDKQPLARRFAASAWLPRLVTALAVIPVLTTLRDVANAGKFQHLDYLFTLTRVTNPDGTLKAFDLRNYLSNEHILGLPSVFYWINIKLFEGDNRTLGVFVVAIAVATVAVLGYALPRTLPPLVRAGLVVASAALMFSPHGLWNYTRAMSGTAWLSANLIVIVAFLLAVRGRWWPAWALAFLGSISYATAFAAWPVLSLLAFARREPWWKRLLPLVVGGAIVLVWYSYRPQAPLAGNPTRDLASMLYYFLAIVGKLWTTDAGAVAAVCGLLLLGVYLALASSKIARERQMWFWWALALHALLGAVMITAARVDYGGEVGMNTARYTSVSVLLTIPALVMLATVVYRRLPLRTFQIAGAVIMVGVLGFALGGPNGAEERVADKEHQVEAIAVHGGFSDAYRRYPPAKDLVPRLRALGHYPFTDDFSLGCGGPEFGSRLDLDDMTALRDAAGNKVPNHPAGAVESVEPVKPDPFFHGKAVPLFRGWAVDGRNLVRCVVITDGSGTIVGGGVSGETRPDIAFKYAGIVPNTGFVAIGPADQDSRIVVVFDDGSMRWLAPQVTR